ncbi:hypothetical protein ALP68_102792 [Pseudomonas ficuserectae]|uniref:Uncharacterized protein n=7 Tax=Pseudomonas syringae group TaxID=136849 RepID=A0A0Q0C598_PSEAJ|nr:hypothetical protein ALO50_103402 [Pseudomonas syringae pv. cerasicola]KPX10730.1 hypothetical protein ALO73_103170 [Pseudomonas syringae pv. daphniphylli]KPX57088.1 hypothetical protein ALO67_102287 [Pseudomonas amygdali pv. hibisci]KPY60611.1 hypothetical protein ALO93_102891 [Pseudomonas amygdali pv. sesami]KPY80951.1 hypothetical protein ALO60_102405 [Pseudomonas amygdali pv. tabaci]KPZ12639.1 hypothetical protein ALO41_102901 [Pseudomonas amygdali pv. ulmi]RMM61636.1 hypothetical prot
MSGEARDKLVAHSSPAMAYALLETAIGTHSNGGAVHGQRRRFDTCIAMGRTTPFFWTDL